jgi:hypothetical protein
MTNVEIHAVNKIRSATKAHAVLLTARTELAVSIQPVVPTVARVGPTRRATMMVYVSAHISIAQAFAALKHRYVTKTPAAQRIALIEIAALIQYAVRAVGSAVLERTVRQMGSVYPEEHSRRSKSASATA